MIRTHPYGRCVPGYPTSSREGEANITPLHDRLTIWIRGAPPGDIHSLNCGI